MRSVLCLTFLSALAAGCVPAAIDGLPDTVEVSAALGDEKTDDVGKRTITLANATVRRFLVTGESPAQTRTDHVTVTDLTADRMSVNGTFYGFTRPVGTYLHLSAKDDHWLSPTDIKFMLFAKTVTGLVRIECIATDAKTHKQALINGFDSMDIDDASFTFEGAMNDTGPNTIIGTTDWFLFAYPSSTWGNLKGSYDYDVTADCNGADCT